MWCAPLSAPSRPQQSKTPTTKESCTLLRSSPRRRSSCSAQDLRRVASQVEPRQDQRPRQERLRLSYNAILGYPALAKFMAVTHHGYNVLKMPGSGRIITVPCEERDAVCSLERAFQAVAIDDLDSRNEGPLKAIPKKKQPRCAGPQEDGVAAGASSGSAPVPGAPPSIA